MLAADAQGGRVLRSITQAVVIVGPVTGSPAMVALERVLAEQGLRVQTLVHGDETGDDRATPHAVLVYTLPSVVAAMQTIRVARLRYPLVPILALGHRESSREIEYLLMAGAREYVRPPHATREFAAAVRAAGDAVGTAPHVHRAPGIVLDEIGMTVSVQGRAVALTAIECAILARLMREPGTVVSAEVLLNDAWPLGVPATMQALRAHVRDLRRKIERNASLPTCILSIRGRGYTFQPEP
ncbi:MAG TPA: response regulator transcription factor [Candidatus Baltobacteraceae bacterium]|nr:response regulator transcription factor [Candidatus Baltobacteraceae bacterium]